jgi:hypothetical protein
MVAGEFPRETICFAKSKKGACLLPGTYPRPPASFFAVGIFFNFHIAHTPAAGPKANMANA